MKRSSIWHVAAALAFALVVGFVALPAVAQADEASEGSVKLDVRFGGAAATGVSDDPTSLKVFKLDTDTHEPVAGAQLQIVEKSSGTVVAEWTSDAAGNAAEFTKLLDVDTRYILREVAAPAGYEQAADTEFYLTSGDDHFSTELVVVSGPATVQAHDGTDAQLVLTNTKQTREVEAEQVVERTTPQSPDQKTTTRSGSGRLAQTGDEGVPFMVIGGLAACGLVIVAVALHRRRRNGAE